MTNDRITETQINVLPLKTSFGVLNHKEFVPVCFLVGDSNVKYKDKDFKRWKANRKVLCRLDATVHTLTSQVKKLGTEKEHLNMVRGGIENH